MQLVVERCMDAQVDIPYYEKNAKDLYKIVTDAGFDALVPQGAFYLWIKSPVADEKELVAAAKEERILMVPGSAFACPGYVRLSFCISNETIQRSAESLRKSGKEILRLVGRVIEQKQGGAPHFVGAARFFLRKIPEVGQKTPDMLLC